MSGFGLFCQEGIYLTHQVQSLCERFEHLIAGDGLDLNKESLIDRRCRLAECRALIDHTRGIQRQLRDHVRLHGCARFVRTQHNNMECQSVG